MRLALIQQAATHDRRANLQRGLAALAEASRQGAEAAIFPELAFDRFLPRCRAEGAAREAARAHAEPIPGPTTDALAAAARRHRLVIVGNLYEIDGEGRTFDASPVLDADGTLRGVTRMLHITQAPGFWEQDYYHPGDRGAPVYNTRAGRIGVAICYDRHFPEVPRALAAAGAELVVIPQAGTAGEWPEGMFEAEVRTAAFQNGFFAALCNRVGTEGELEFCGESFACDPEGRILGRAKCGVEDLLLVDLDFAQAAASTARRLFWRHRRPELYRRWLDEEPAGG